MKEQLKELLEKYQARIETIENVLLPALDEEFDEAVKPGSKINILTVTARRQELFERLRCYRLTYTELEAISVSG